MIRPLLQEVLGHVVHARMDMQALQLAVIEELQSGYRPTYRGHAWEREQFEDLEAAAAVIEAAFHLVKAVQFPEMRRSRWTDALAALERADDKHHQDGGKQDVTETNAHVVPFR